MWTTRARGYSGLPGVGSAGIRTGIGDPSSLWIVREMPGLGDHVAPGDLAPLALPGAPVIGVGP